MKMTDKQVVEHILPYCRRISEAIQRFGESYETFKADAFYQDGIAMCVMQIGELTKKLTPEFRVGTEKEFHWKAIAGMRDRYAHGYLSMNIETIWETASQDIPTLAKQCAELLERIREEEAQEIEDPEL